MIKEECGVFGIYDFDGGDVASTIYYGLLALQHRGQESCGIAVSDTSGPKGKVLSSKDMGLVNEAFTTEILEKLKGILVSDMSDILQQAALPEKCSASGIKLCEGYTGTCPQWKSDQCSGAEKRTGIYRSYLPDDYRFRGDRLFYCKGAAEFQNGRGSGRTCHEEDQGSLLPDHYVSP